MPIYEYRCNDCGYQVDYFQSYKESPKAVCPRCQGRLSRMVTKGAGLIFKGSGFYETDYKRKERDFGKRNGSGKYLKKEEHEPSHKQPAVNDKKQSVTENS